MHGGRSFPSRRDLRKGHAWETALNAPRSQPSLLRLEAAFSDAIGARGETCLRKAAVARRRNAAMPRIGRKHVAALAGLLGSGACSLLAPSDDSLLGGHTPATPD